MREESFPIGNGVTSQAFRDAMNFGPIREGHKDFPKVLDAVRKKGYYSMELPFNTHVKFEWIIKKEIVYKNDPRSKV